MAQQPPPPGDPNPSTGDKGPFQRRRQAPAFLPPELMQVLFPTIQVGGIAGGLGLWVGAMNSILSRTHAPVLFALSTGGQWFALASSYYASKRVIVEAWGGDAKMTPSWKVQASTIAGGCAGVVGGLLRGPKNIVPGSVMFALFGAGGQAVANAYAGWSASGRPEKKTSWLESKWSPVTPLSDTQYQHMLEEKILKIDAEIAIVDENIASLKASQSPALNPPQT